VLQFLRQSAQKPTRHLSIESRGPCFSLSMKFRGLARVNERAARLKRYLQITKALSEDALGAINCCSTIGRLRPRSDVARFAATRFAQESLSCRLVIKISFVNGYLGLPDNVDRHKTLYTCAHRAPANCIGLPFSSTPTWQCSRRRISGAKLARPVPRSQKFDEASTSARDRRCPPTVAEVSFKS
jgi:hypothetical protein